MQVNSIDDAINITMKKYGYNESQRKQIYEELEKNNFSVITSDYGARKFVSNYYQNLKSNIELKNINQPMPFSDFTTLTKYFNQILTNYGISKENRLSFNYLYQELNKGLKGQYQQDIQSLIIQAAKGYSQKTQNYAQVLRKYDFDTPDITRKEAADITSIYISMEHQKQRVYDSFYRCPAYQKQLIVNLIEYSYYENDFSISLDEQIETCKSSII